MGRGMPMGNPYAMMQGQAVGRGGGSMYGPPNAPMYGPPGGGAPQGGTSATGGARPMQNPSNFRSGQGPMQGAAVPITNTTGSAVPAGAAGAPPRPKSKAIQIVDPTTMEAVEVPQPKPKVPPPAAPPAPAVITNPDGALAPPLGLLSSGAAAIASGDTAPNIDAAKALAPAPSSDAPRADTATAPMTTPPPAPTPDPAPAPPPEQPAERPAAPAPAPAAQPAPAATSSAAEPPCTAPPASATSVNAPGVLPDTSAKADDDDDDWESKDVSDLKIEDKSPKKPSGLPTMSLRPGGGPPGGMSFASATKSAVIQPSNGKKMYDKEFLMQFQPACTEPPKGLPDMEVISVGPGVEDKGAASAGKGGRGGGPAAAGGEWQRFGPKGGAPAKGVGPPAAGRDFDPRANSQYQKGGLPSDGGKGRDRGRGRGGDRRGGGFEMVVKPLEKSDNAWAPQHATKSSLEESQKLERNTKALLNKFTPEKFEKLTDQFLDLDIKDRTDMVMVIDMVFDKALFEPVFGHMYAMLCARCAEKFPEFPDERNPEAKPHTFKRLLLNKCQEEFERENNMQDELDALPDQGSEKLNDDAREMVRIQTKKRMLGNIRFIGELYKQKMLTEKIMHECLIKLLGDIENPSEDEVECLCKLMITIGKSIDHPKAKSHMDEYFSRMAEMSRNEALSNRMRFMLQETIDLRRGNWVERKPDPAKKASAQVSSSKIQMGGGDVRKEMAGGKPPGRGAPAGKGQGAGPSRAGEWETAGSARGKGAPPAGKSGAAAPAPAPAPTKAPPPLTVDEVLVKLEGNLEEFLSCGDMDELVTCLKELMPRVEPGSRDLGKQLVQFAIPKSFDARSDDPRQKVSLIFGGMHKAKLLTAAELQACFTDILEFVEDEVCDVPHIGAYVAGFIARALYDGALPPAYLAGAFVHLVECETESVSAARLTLNALQSFSELAGQEMARKLYTDAKLNLLTLLPPTEAEIGKPVVAELLESAGLAFLDPGLAEQVQNAKRQEQAAQLEAQLAEIEGHLLVSMRAQPPESDGAIMEWLQQRVDPSVPNVKVARLLMRCLLDTSSDEMPPSSTKLNAAIKERAKLLRKFLQVGKDPEQMMLMCCSLYEVQAFCARLPLSLEPRTCLGEVLTLCASGSPPAGKNWPDKLMKKLFYQLYEADIILEEAYSVWREDTSDDTPGKDKALFQVNEFLQWLETTEEEGEEDGD